MQPGGLPWVMLWLAVSWCGAAGGVGAKGCDGEVCASVVSKCQLEEACGCNMDDPTNCTCCAECSLCLGLMYPVCCSCVGLCSGDGVVEGGTAVAPSSVEDLSEAIPGLFDLLTEQGVLGAEPQDSLWTTQSYPVMESILKRLNKAFGVITISLGQDGKNVFRSGGRVVGVSPAVNCTVAYIDACSDLSVCKDTCRSMGAARLRWFHEHGCCECVGHRCVDYGREEAQCKHCPFNGQGRAPGRGPKESRPRGPDGKLPEEEEGEEGWGYGAAYDGN